MAIAATTLQYEVRKKINRINSNFSKSIGVADLDAYLNEAKDKVFENYAALAETNTTIRNHLRQLEEKKVCLECTSVDERCCKIDYPENFYMLLNQQVKAAREGCEERILTTYIVQSNEVDRTYKDTHRCPSWQWCETIADEAGDSLYIYLAKDTDKDQCKGFDVKEVCIDYLRKPKDICTPSLTKSKKYIKSDGVEVSEDCDLEMDSTFLWRKIVDVAALLYHRSVAEVNDYQTQLNEILSVDKLYLQ